MADAPIPQLHDSFFKACLQNTDVAVDLLKAALPSSISTRCNFTSLKLESASFVESDFRSHHGDLLFGVDIDKKKGFLYLLLEHQSTPDKWMAVRMHRYMSSIFKRSIENSNSLPVVVPLVVYAGNVSPYPYSWDLMHAFQDPALARNVFLGFQELAHPTPSSASLEPFSRAFYLLDLTILSEDDMGGFGKAQIVTMLLKNIENRDIFSLSERALAICYAHALSAAILLQVLQYITTKLPYKGSKRIYLNFLKKKAAQYHYQEDIMTFADLLKEEGIEEGIKKGRQEGKLEGRVEGKQEERYIIAKNLLSEGMEEKLILRVTGLTRKALQNLKNELRRCSR